MPASSSPGAMTSMARFGFILLLGLAGCGTGPDSIVRTRPQLRMPPSLDLPSLDLPKPLGAEVDRDDSV